MSAFDDYLAQLRRLDEVRRTADERSARQATATESLGQRTERLAGRATAQRQAVDELAHQARTDAPRGAAPAPVAVGDPGVEVGAAEADLDTAAAELEEARFLAHRPPWLPRWRADERNGLLYGLFAIAGMLAQMLVLRLSDGDGLAGTLAVAGLVIACPLAAFALGWLTIGVVSRPRINEPEKLQRNPRLGLVICSSTLVVSCIAIF